MPLQKVPDSVLTRACLLVEANENENLCTLLAVIARRLGTVRDSQQMSRKFCQSCQHQVASIKELRERL